MDSATYQKLADATKLNNDLFQLVEKQRIQLDAKDKELQENRQANEKLLTDLDLEKARAKRADELETALASAAQTILTFKMAIWKSLPSADLCYYIKVPSGPGGAYAGYLHQNHSTNYLCASTDALTAASSLQSARFKFTKNLDGTFYIHSMTMERSLQAQTQHSYQTITSFTFSPKLCNQSTFVLFYNHQKQNKEPGILVDIYSLANGLFLSATVGNQHNRVVANSRNARPKKFLIVPVE